MDVDKLSNVDIVVSLAFKWSGIPKLVSSLLGRLETLGPGGAAARGRRTQAAELDRRWRQETEAHSLVTR